MKYSNLQAEISALRRLQWKRISKLSVRLLRLTHLINDPTVIIEQKIQVKDLWLEIFVEMAGLQKSVMQYERP